MIQLRILSGKMAGDTQVVRRFPFNIGRAAGNDLILDEPGVWDRHLTLGFEKGEGFTLQTAPETFAAINEESKTSARLRNGDIISVGVDKRSINLEVRESEIARRLAEWRPPDRTFQRGYNKLFAAHIQQADKGCDFDFLEGTAPTPEPEIH